MYDVVAAWNSHKISMMDINSFLTNDMISSSIPIVIMYYREGINEAVLCNHEFEKLTGYKSNEIVKKNSKFLFARSQESRELNKYREGMKKNVSFIVELVGRRKDGTTYNVEVISNHVRVEQENYFICCFRDISEKENLKLQEAHIASHDCLTDVLNHDSFLASSNHLLTSTQPSAMFLFIIFNCNNFKDTNKRFGSCVGDSILAIFGNCLQFVFGNRICNSPHEILVGRIGGDEFAVCVVISGMQLSSSWIESQIERVQKLTIAKCNSGVPFSASAGYVVRDRSSIISIKDCLASATQIMRQRKLIKSMWKWDDEYSKIKQLTNQHKHFLLLLILASICLIR